MPILRMLGLLRPFSIPTGSMTPAASAGDHLFMEGISYLNREPHRGDIVIFKNRIVSKKEPEAIYIKRVLGEPGEHVRLTDGKLFINDKPVALSNTLGLIVFATPTNHPIQIPETDATVPAGCYFVVGDNSTNSYDSRYYGSIPRKDILGRAFFCYWPPARIGGIK